MPETRELSRTPPLVLDIEPIGKPRMTQSDRWKQRPAVLRYRAFCDGVRALMGGRELPASGAHIIFEIPMPSSWSRKKREAMAGQPHTQKPDVDNICKALLDALHTDDSHIWDIRITKRWGVEGKIVIQSGRGRHMDDIETNIP